ncbi:hypothetical protein ACX80S_07655 [Arthrobacter sp. RHLT1-20]
MLDFAGVEHFPAAELLVRDSTTMALPMAFPGAGGMAPMLGFDAVVG